MSPLSGGRRVVNCFPLTLPNSSYTSLQLCTQEIKHDPNKKGKDSPYSIAEHRVPEVPVLGSQPAGDVSHKPGSRLLLISARPAVTFATLNRAATSFAAW